VNGLSRVDSFGQNNQISNKNSHRPSLISDYRKNSILRGQQQRQIDVGAGQNGVSLFDALHQQLTTQNNEKGGNKYTR